MNFPRDNDPGTEGEALSDWIEGMQADNTPSPEVLETLHKRYEAAKTAVVGSVIRCPACNKPHTKTTYHKIFNARRCKDEYWNTVDETRRVRAKEFHR